jgi:hypothetical protein
MMQRLRSYSDLLLFVALILFAAWLMWWQSNRLDAAAVATLVGALVGASALLRGNWITRWNDRARAQEALDERRAKVTALITAELVNVAAGSLQAKALIDPALEQLRTAGGTIPGAEIASGLPREMPLTVALGTELLLLEEPALDALVTLQSNLSVSPLNLQQFVDAPVQLGLLRLEALAARAPAQGFNCHAECLSARGLLRD